MATTDAGSGSSHRCQVMSGSSSQMIPINTNAAIRATDMMVVGACIRKLRLWRTGSLLDVLLFLSSLLLFFGSRPSTKGVGTGFYHQSMDLEFPCRPDGSKDRHWAVRIGTGTYDFLRVLPGQKCTMLPSLSFPYRLYGYAAQEVCASTGG